MQQGCENEVVLQARKAREAGTNPKELEVTAQPGNTSCLFNNVFRNL